jgi:transposase
MRQIREILRLRFLCHQSQRSIEKSCQISKTAVFECLHRAQAADLSWPLPDGLDDTALEALLYPTHVNTVDTERSPDWSTIYLELKKKGVTRLLVWEEYLGKTPGGVGYSRFCKLFSEWLQKQRISMRQEHKAGEKLFVDFAGQTVPIHDPDTGNVIQAQIFVAAWGASSYCYAEAVPSQSLPFWLGAHVNALEFFGCSPEVVVPDNLRSAVKNPCRYDPETNPSYAELAAHYGFAVIPARARKPKDKAKAELSVQLVTRWILAVLRHRKFFSIRELNDAIRELLTKLNDRPFQKLPGCRKSQFEDLDRPAAKPLPGNRYEFAEIIKQKVNIDYHVVADSHFYSVPYQLRGQKIVLRLTIKTVEVLHKNIRIFTHVRNHQKWKYTTIPEHLPDAHRAHAEWSPQRIVGWAKGIGDSTAELVAAILRSKAHPEQGYRSWLGILRLSRHYGNERVEAACKRALLTGKHRYIAVKEILLRGLDRQPLPSRHVAFDQTPIHHENIRGGEYYNVSTNGESDASESDNRQA